MTTTPEQDKIIEALTAEHGAVKVLPLCGTLACGWREGSEEDDICSYPIGKWWYVPIEPAMELSVAAGPSLRYAYEQEIADAFEQDAVRELLSAAGLEPVVCIQMCECERFTADECKASKACSG